MIIDLIVDRQYGEGYNPKKFYNEVMECNSIFDNSFDYILKAMDTKNEDNVKRALCKYIIEQDYNLELMHFILSTTWILE